MAYTKFDYQKPDPSVDNGTDAFTNTRTNLLAIRDGVMLGVMPDWNMTPSGGTAEEPAELLYSKGSERLKAAITWGTSGGNDGNPTSIVYSYSSDSGTSFETIGTQSFTYDANGNVTGISWS